MQKRMKTAIKHKLLNAKNSLLLLASVGLSGCVVMSPATSSNTSTTTSSASTVNTSSTTSVMPNTSHWQLHYISDTDIAEAMQYRTFSLHYENTQLSGRAGNSFSTTARFYGNGKVNVSPRLMTSRMLVRGVKGKMEKRYFQLISTTNAWKITDKQLTLYSPHGELLFNRQ